MLTQFIRLADITPDAYLILSAGHMPAPVRRLEWLAGDMSPPAVLCAAALPP